WDPPVERQPTVFHGTDWNENMYSAFQDLKIAFISAPVLGLPDSMFVRRKDLLLVFLVQKHGSDYRPVAYYSSKLGPVVLGKPGCVRSVAAVLQEVKKDLKKRSLPYF
uniref:Reverse transcriptase/retrotransposon-derived protein RNase H-like domain-containing protein n=1 Tax=Labrus bergylta TaxID=56723 RepID=A0A3Q3LPW6_9LABR